MHILHCPALPGEKTLTDVACQQSLFALSTRQAYNASSELAESKPARRDWSEQTSPRGTWGRVYGSR